MTQRLFGIAPYRRLRVTTALSMFAVVALPAVISGAGFYWFAQRAVVKEVEFEISLVAAHEEARVSDWIRERRFDLGVIGRVGSINAAVESALRGREQVSDSLRYLLDRAQLFFRDRYTSFRVYGPDGTPTLGGSDTLDRSTLDRIMADSVSIAPRVIPVGDSKFALEVFAPIVGDSGIPRAVLAATAPLEPLFTLLHTPVSSIGAAHLFDQDGQLLASTSRDIPDGPDVSQIPDLSRLIGPLSDSSQYTRHGRSSDIMGAARRIPEVNWIVAVERNRDQALERLVYMRIILFSVIAAIVFLGGGLAVAMSSLTVGRLERREMELRTTHEQLITADRLASVGMMAASMAHEINNPLTTIKVLIHSLHERAAPKQALQTDFNIVLSEIDKIKALVLRFLQFARPRDPEFSAVRLEDILSRIAGLIRHQAQSHGILIYEKYGNSLGSVWADGSQIGQMFLNILLNAIDATPPGGEVHITASVTDDDRAGVTIRNSGPGLPDEIKEKIFEPFFSTKTTGTGLGLSIARTIVEKHGGEISAKGHGENGTTFTILLRRRAGEPS